METNKTEKKTDLRKIGRIATLCIPVVVLVLIVAAVLSTTVLFKVKNFDIEGNKRYSPAQIMEASGLEEGKNMFVSNIDKASEAIKTKLPYIEEVTIKRKLPDSIVITVKESKEVYGLNAANKWFVINGDGKIIEMLESEEPKDVSIKVWTSAVYNPQIGSTISYVDPEVTTKKENKKDKEKSEKDMTPFEMFKLIKSEIDKTNLKGKITIINLIDKNSIKLLYDGRIKLDMGDIAEINEKISFAAGALKNEDSINPDQHGTMDLTVSHQAHFYPEDRANKK